MKLTEQINFIKKNIDTINVSGIAKQLNMDASNFHKVINKDLGLSAERQKKLTSIIRKLSVKTHYNKKQ